MTQPEKLKKYSLLIFDWDGTLMDSRSYSEGPHLFLNVHSTLCALKEKGYTLAVATSMGRQSLDMAMQRFGVLKFFSATRCSEETAPKPDPAMLHSLLEEFDLSSKQALMIGDTEWDMQMAQSIRMDCVAVITGMHSADRLQKCHPLACVDDIQDIISML